jgi:hypothetical protein
MGLRNREASEQVGLFYSMIYSFCVWLSNGSSSGMIRATGVCVCAGMRACGHVCDYVCVCVCARLRLQLRIHVSMCALAGWCVLLVTCCLFASSLTNCNACVQLNIAFLQAYKHPLQCSLSLCMASNTLVASTDIFQVCMHLQF